MATISEDLSRIVTVKTGAMVEMVPHKNGEAVDMKTTYQTCRQEDLLEIAAFLLLHAAKLRSTDA